MKRCYTCKESKSTEEFNKNKSRKDGLQSRCRLCDQKRAKDYFHKNKTSLLPMIAERKLKRVIKAREFVFSYLKENPCVDCGNTDIRVLEFDHIQDKTQGISRMIADGYKVESIQKEISKCEVRCANCHRIKTGLQMGFYSYMD